MGFHQGHVLPGSAAATEAGGGLDEVRAGLGDDLTHLNFFFLSQQTSLDDDFQQLAVTGGLDRLDLLQQGVPLLVLHPAQVDDHVDLRCALFYSGLRLEALDGGGVVAVGEADDGADGQAALEVLCRLLHVAGGGCRRWRSRSEGRRRRFAEFQTRRRSGLTTCDPRGGAVLSVPYV